MRAARREPRMASSLLPALLVGLATMLVGCALLSPRPVRTPSTSGVVDAITRLQDGGTSYRLQNGDSVVIPGQKEVLLGGEPLVGELLLSGTDSDGSTWVAGVSQGAPGLPDGCFFLPSQGHADGEWIETSTGFRLRKAATFVDPRDADGDDFPSDRGGFCLSEGAEVTRYEP